MIFAKCPHGRRHDPGEPCEECLSLGAGVIELTETPVLTDDGWIVGKIIQFYTPLTQGLTNDEMRTLLGDECADKYLAERRAMTAEQEREAYYEPYAENVETADAQAYETALQDLLDRRVREMAGDFWRPAAFLVLPEPGAASWAAALVGAEAEELRSVLREQVKRRRRPTAGSRQGTVTAMDDFIDFSSICPHCGHLAEGANYRGGGMRCPRCGREF